MIGGNAEFGAHAYHSRKMDLYAAAGPYYFAGHGRSTWGGEGRLAFTGLNFLRLQLSGSYDKIFKGIVQGEIGLFYAWGGKKVVKKRGCLNCRDSRMIVKRALQRVDRQEIIVASHKHKTSTAINPVTGDPYTFWFVNNLSNGLGTVESPFSTLAAAQSASSSNDVIYVFPGDGTDAGMNAGIILKNGEQLLGAGINQTIQTTSGNITIPAQASGLPIISNRNDPTKFGVQLIAGNNVVSGFNLQDVFGVFFGNSNSGALTILGGTQYLIQNNTISSKLDGAGLNIFGGGDNTVITDNLFLSVDAGTNDNGIFIAQTSTTPPLGGTITISNNTFRGDIPTSLLFIGIDCEPSFYLPTPGLPALVLITSNNIMKETIFGISMTNRQGGPSSITLQADNNNILLPNLVGAGIDVHEQATATGPINAFINGNIVQPSPPATGYVFQNLSGDPAKLQVQFGENVGTRVGP